MQELPIHDTTSFGSPEAISQAKAPTNPSEAPSDAATQLISLNFLELAPAADATRPRPSVKRVLSADGVNHVLFTFLPGQELPDHKAAHPITVQVLQGSVDFECAGNTHQLSPGSAVYLPAYLPHAVRKPLPNTEQAAGSGALGETLEEADKCIMLLSMHTPR